MGGDWWGWREEVGNEHWFSGSDAGAPVDAEAGDRERKANLHRGRRKCCKNPGSDGEYRGGPEVKIQCLFMVRDT